MVLRKTLDHLDRKTQMATQACRETCFTAYPVLRVGFMPECVVCCIQVAYATNRTSTENWLQLRQLERKEFSALGLINPSGRDRSQPYFQPRERFNRLTRQRVDLWKVGSDYPVRRLASQFSRIAWLSGSIVVKAIPIPEF